MQPDAVTTRGLVDFHCHLDLYPDHAAAVEECDRAGIRTLAVTTTPRAWPRNRDLAAATRHVRPALGLHPQLVAERSSELALWERYLDEARYVGEVGLDAGQRFFGSLALQKDVFRHILIACAARGGKILSIHAVRATATVLDMLEEHLPNGRGQVVLHWFSGTKAEARRAVALGCYFSINMEMLHKPQQRELVANLPQERLLTETDGPFTTLRDRPMRPADVRTTVEMLASVRTSNAASMVRVITANLRALVES